MFIGHMDHIPRNTNAELPARPCPDLKWKVLISPTKSISFEQLVWSKRLDSVHKDSECLFGLLKARFRIL